MISAHPSSPIDTSHDVLPGMPGEGTAGNLSAEQSLFAAVILQAKEDYLKNAGAREGHGLALFRDAEAWLACASTDRLSFRWYCHAIGIDPDFIWRRIREERARGTQRPAAAA